jgi:transcriptional regulator with XRE-family HTH domain
MYAANRNPAREKTSPLSPQALYRGLYMRIARKLGVDPSYVSRVARGQRRSAIIGKALRHELDQINRKLDGTRFTVSTRRSAPRRHQGQRLRRLVKGNRGWIRREWLRHCEADPILRSFPLSAQKRVSPVLRLVEEAMKLSAFPSRDIMTTPRKAAERHARLRRAQGYSVNALIEEYNLVRRCITGVAEKHFQQMDDHLLFHDLSQVGKAIDLQMQSALRYFLRRA